MIGSKMKKINQLRVRATKIKVYIVTRYKPSIFGDRYLWFGINFCKELFDLKKKKKNKNFNVSYSFNNYPNYQKIEAKKL